MCVCVCVLLFFVCVFFFQVKYFKILLKRTHLTLTEFSEEKKSSHLYLDFENSLRCAKHIGRKKINKKFKEIQSTLSCPIVDSPAASIILASADSAFSQRLFISADHLSVLKLDFVYKTCNWFTFEPALLNNM